MGIFNEAFDCKRKLGNRFCCAQTMILMYELSQEFKRVKATTSLRIYLRFAENLSWTTSEYTSGSAENKNSINLHANQHTIIMEKPEEGVCI